MKNKIKFLSYFVFFGIFIIVSLLAFYNNETVVFYKEYINKQLASISEDSDVIVESRFEHRGLFDSLVKVNFKKEDKEPFLQITYKISKGLLSISDLEGIKISGDIYLLDSLSNGIYFQTSNGSPNATFSFVPKIGSDSVISLNIKPQFIYLNKNENKSPDFSLIGHKSEIIIDQKNYSLSYSFKDESINAVKEGVNYEKSPDLSNVSGIISVNRKLVENKKDLFYSYKINVGEIAFIKGIKIKDLALSYGSDYKKNYSNKLLISSPQFIYSSEYEPLRLELDIKTKELNYQYLATDDYRELFKSGFSVFVDKLILSNSSVKFSLLGKLVFKSTNFEDYDILSNTVISGKFNVSGQYTTILGSILNNFTQTNFSLGKDSFYGSFVYRDGSMSLNSKTLPIGFNEGLNNYLLEVSKNLELANIYE